MTDWDDNIEFLFLEWIQDFNQLYLGHSKIAQTFTKKRMILKVSLIFIGVAVTTNNSFQFEVQQSESSKMFFQILNIILGALVTFISTLISFFQYDVCAHVHQDFANRVNAFKCLIETELFKSREARQSASYFINYALEKRTELLMQNPSDIIVLEMRGISRLKKVLQLSSYLDSSSSGKAEIHELD
jgi:hypothetical protein